MKQGDVLLQFLFNFALDYPIVKVIVMWQRLKFWGAHQCLVRADDVNLLGEIYSKKTQKLDLLQVRKLV